MIDEVIAKLSILGLDGISRSGIIAGFKGSKKLSAINNNKTPHI
jgi:hypothetical protein